jgi:uncharacterized protein YebE (UPF0316 family)
MESVPMSLMAFALPTLPILPVVVFLAELCVVTISTLRIIFVSRGHKILAPTLGFFEITIWLFAISQVMQNLSDPACFLGFAGGFTLGNYFGILIEKRLALGTVVVRTITHRDAGDLIDGLREAGYGVTIQDAEGGRGPVKMVSTVVPRREQESVLTIIRHFDAEAFYSVLEIQDARPNAWQQKGRRREIMLAILQRSPATLWSRVLSAGKASDYNGLRKNHAPTF